jgi:hypothetical protein
MDGLVTEDDKQEMNNEEYHYYAGVDKDCSQAFFSSISLVNGVSLLALVLSGGGSHLLEV